MEDYTAIAEQVAQLVMEQLQLLEKDPYQVPVGVSARHIHLERRHLDALFGEGYQLTPFKALSQPGQYASEETVEVIGTKGKPVKLRVLGPERKHTQVEVSLSDSRNLGIIPPVRTSGDVSGTPGIKIRGPKGEIEIDEGVIIPDRHIHMTPEDARWYGVKNGEKVQVAGGGSKGGILDQVVIRVSETAALDFHIDTDDANAFQMHQGQMVRIIKN
jgi:putative phosphotransacetylase